ncbi:hypothetical protein BV22DRAFT_1052223, partial [Leucogyrophana mollusca]
MAPSTNKTSKFNTGSGEKDHNGGQSCSHSHNHGNRMMVDNGASDGLPFREENEEEASSGAGEGETRRSPSPPRKRRGKRGRSRDHSRERNTRRRPAWTFEDSTGVLLHPTDACDVCRNYVLHFVEGNMADGGGLRYAKVDCDHYWSDHLGVPQYEDRIDAQILRFTSHFEATTTLSRARQHQRAAMQFDTISMAFDELLGASIYLEGPNGVEGRVRRGVVA